MAVCNGRRVHLAAPKPACDWQRKIRARKARKAASLAALGASSRLGRRNQRAQAPRANQLFATVETGAERASARARANANEPPLSRPPTRALLSRRM